MRGVVVYRGPLERSRISFLLETMREMGADFSLIWIYPGKLSTEQRKNFERFIAPYHCDMVEVLEHGARNWLSTRRRLRAMIDAHVEVVMAIGFSSLYFLPRLRQAKVIWCINGIPEEEVLSGAGGRAAPYLKWQLTRLGHADAVVVVSRRMQDLVRRFHRRVPIVVAPTCVDLSVFGQVPHSGAVGRRKYLGYLGTGAEWQALDLLSELWQAIHAIDPQTQFRVISRDSRTSILANNIPSSNVQFVKSDDFREVAEYLTEVEIGFLIRRENLVNRVSFPTKLGEYLASGAWVVTSSIDWDIEDFIERNGCGLVLASSNDALESACAVIRLREAVRSGEIDVSLERAAAQLDRTKWVDSTAEALRSHL